jgi:hypothetical protein
MTVFYSDVTSKHFGFVTRASSGEAAALDVVATKGLGKAAHTRPFVATYTVPSTQTAVWDATDDVVPLVELPPGFVVVSLFMQWDILATGTSMTGSFGIYNDDSPTFTAFPTFGTAHYLVATSTFAVLRAVFTPTTNYTPQTVRKWVCFRVAAATSATPVVGATISVSGIMVRAGSAT